MFSVKEIMTDNIVAIRSDATIDEAIRLLLEFKVSGMPVVDADGQLVGVISEVDIIDLVYEADIETSIVRDHMSASVQVLEASASIDEAANMFCSHSVRRFPVVHEGQLVGVLSRRDLIRFIRYVRKEAVHSS